MIEQLKGWLGAKLNGISLNIDIVNGCVLACPSCAVGSIGRRPSHYMDLEKFIGIIGKAKEESLIRKVQLYIYSDPCMHPNLDIFVEVCRVCNIPVLLSTVLQHTQCDWRKVIEARPAEFRISFAGWDKMKYYQRGADPSLFNHNFAYVTSLPRYPETVWTLIFHLYKDNGHEYHRAKALAHLHNLKFVAIPSIFMINEKVVEQSYTDDDRELISHLQETPEQAIDRMKVDHDYCLLWKQISMDAKGDLYLCQLLYEDRFKLGVNFMDLPVKEILKRIKTAPFCWWCLRAGGHTYQYCYSEISKYDDPVGMAEARRSKHRE